jgi:hypothetical protein
MAAPSLQHSALNLLSVKQLAERDFMTVLQMLRGKKALVLDATLSGPLGLITEKQTLRENGVEKTFHLLPEPLQTDQSQVHVFCTIFLSSVNSLLLADNFCCSFRYSAHADHRPAHTCF